MKIVFINGRLIGPKHPPYIIAEMSGNHNQSLEKAKNIVRLAAEAGVDAIKLQTYTADTMTFPGVWTVEDGSLWEKRELYDLYKQAYTPWEWHKEIFDYAKEVGITAFSSPFDETAVDFLESLNVPAYKIASFENSDIPLLRKVASTKKPVILSTGVADIGTIEEAVNTLREYGTTELILLKCTSTYPASAESSNLRTIPHLERMFDVVVGISDHTRGIGTSVGAVALGARVIEKHFTDDKALGGVDAAFSLEPKELKALVQESHQAFLSLGSVKYGVQDVEKQSYMYKRSLFIIKDLKKGELLSNENIRILRPGLGLEPKFYDIALGKKVNKDIPKGTPLQWNHFLSDNESG